jgi:peroxiredoxin
MPRLDSACLRIGVFLGILAALPLLEARADTPPTVKIGQKIAGFTLKDTAGNPWSLDSAKDKKAVVVVFLGTECPINNAFIPRLLELNKTYEPQGVVFVAVNSNKHDSARRVAEHAKENAIFFPVLKDEGNAVADQFGALRTPEACLLDASGALRYRGRIDDQFGVAFKRPAPTRRDLAEAIEEVLAGKQVSQPETEVSGCYIARVKKTPGAGSITFSKDVARILQNRCQECHRPGQIGPMALLTYDDVASWSETIREVIEERRMPPWHADPKHGKFQNDRSLTQAERDTLLGWIKQGCPPGDPKELPPAKEFADGWRIGKPDQVFTMGREFNVPAEMKGGVPYQHFEVPTNFTEDMWVRAAEAKPGNRAVVHHIIVYVFDPAKGRVRDEDGIGNGFLVGFAPGDMPLVLEPGQAKKVPKGALLVFQMHYTPNGTAQTDRSSVGLIFAKEPPKEMVKTRAIAQRNFAIPAGAENHEVVSSTTFRQDTELLSLMPHMHLRGKDFEYRVIFPDGKTDTLLAVPRFDFGWQSNYRLEKPLKLPAGTRIECTAHYDNSKNNPNNPDPTKKVSWGDQTWEEMMIGFVDYRLSASDDKK